MNEAVKSRVPDPSLGSRVSLIQLLYNSTAGLFSTVSLGDGACYNLARYRSVWCQVVGGCNHLVLHASKPVGSWQSLNSVSSSGTVWHTPGLRPLLQDPPLQHGAPLPTCPRPLKQCWEPAKPSHLLTHTFLEHHLGRSDTGLLF